MGRARATPPRHLLPELKSQVLPAATLSLCPFPIPSLLIPGFFLSPLACFMVSRARRCPCPPHPGHPPRGLSCFGRHCQCPACSFCFCPCFQEPVTIILLPA